MTSFGDDDDEELEEEEGFGECGHCCSKCRLFFIEQMRRGHSLHLTEGQYAPFCVSHYCS